jgi:hypothetical protein
LGGRQNFRGINNDWFARRGRISRGHSWGWRLRRFRPRQIERAIVEFNHVAFTD